MAISAIFKEDLNPQIEAATAGMQAWNLQASLSGEAARLFGTDAGKLAEAFAKISDETKAGFFRFSFDELANPLAKIEKGLSNDIELIQTFDSVLAAMVSSGNASQAGAEVAAMAALSHRSIEDLLELLPEYRGAVETGAAETKKLGGAEIGRAHV